MVCFDALDDDLLRQILLRCRASDFPALDRTCKRLSSTVQSAVFREQRIASEWAEARAVVEKRDDDDDDDDDEWSCTEQTMDLIVDNKKAGKASFTTISRYTANGEFYEFCDGSSGELDEIARRFFDSNGIFLDETIHIFAEAEADDELPLFYIHRISWNDDYREYLDSSCIGANVVSSFLTESRMKDDWFICFYIAESEAQYTASHRQKVQENRAEEQRLLGGSPGDKPPGHYERLLQRDRQERDFLEQDIRPFLRAGFQQIDSTRILFLVPKWAENELLSDKETKSVPIQHGCYFNHKNRDFRRRVYQILNSMEDAREKIVSNSLGGPEYAMTPLIQQAVAHGESALTAIQLEIAGMNAKISRFRDVLRAVEDEKDPFLENVMAETLELYLPAVDTVGLTPAKRNETIAKINDMIDSIPLDDKELQKERTLRIIQSLTNAGELLQAGISNETAKANNHIRELQDKLKADATRYVNDIGATVRDAIVIHMCASRSEPVFIEFLLTLVPDDMKKAALNDFDQEGLTPLMKAASRGNVRDEDIRVATIEVLLRLGADKDARCCVGETALKKYERARHKRLSCGSSSDDRRKDDIEALLRPSDQRNL